jgi:hypothetical protein
MRYIELRVKVDDGVEDLEVEALGESLQQSLPALCDEENVRCSDVTFEIKTEETPKAKDRDFYSFDELIGYISEEHAHCDNNPWDDFVRFEMVDESPITKWTVIESLDNLHKPPKRFLRIVASDE